MDNTSTVIPGEGNRTDGKPQVGRGLRGLWNRAVNAYQTKILGAEGKFSPNETAKGLAEAQELQKDFGKESKNTITNGKENAKNSRDYIIGDRYNPASTKARPQKANIFSHPNPLGSNPVDRTGRTVVSSVAVDTDSTPNLPGSRPVSRASLDSTPAPNPPASNQAMPRTARRDGVDAETIANNRRGRYFENEGSNLSADAGPRPGSKDSAIAMGSHWDVASPQNGHYAKIRDSVALVRGDVITYDVKQSPVSMANGAKKIDVRDGERDRSRERVVGR
jgi:hypothetical protein